MALLPVIYKFRYIFHTAFFSIQCFIVPNGNHRIILMAYCSEEEETVFEDGIHLAQGRV
jgi:hypothetical protein